MFHDKNIESFRHLILQLLPVHKNFFLNLLMIILVFAVWNVKIKFEVPADQNLNIREECR